MGKGIKFKTATNNSLMELRSLLNKMESLIDRDYCHVSHFLSNTFTSQLQTAINEVEKEVTKREL